MTNPYQILGVAGSATNDEIKNAYRAMCRKYHPDRNPGNEAAEDMFILVQSAYDAIMNERKGAPSQSPERTLPQTGSDRMQKPADLPKKPASSVKSENKPKKATPRKSKDEYMQSVVENINTKNYREAVNDLLQVHYRNAYWYYLSAVANAGLGNNFVALDHAQTACELSPGNEEYHAFADRLTNAGNRYRNKRGGKGADSSEESVWARLNKFDFSACRDIKR